MKIFLILIVIFINVTASELGFYKNTRFGFSGQYPSKLFINKFESDNGDGVILTSQNRKVKCTFSGSNNVLESTLKEEYYSQLKSAKNDSTKKITYKVLKKKWFVTSGYNYTNKTIFYNKIFHTKNNSSNIDIFTGFYLEYPTKDKKRYNSLVKIISKNFEPYKDNMNNSLETKKVKILNEWECQKTVMDINFDLESINKLSNTNKINKAKEILNRVNDIAYRCNNIGANKDFDLDGSDLYGTINLKIKINDILNNPSKKLDMSDANKEIHEIIVGRVDTVITGTTRMIIIGNGEQCYLDMLHDKNNLGNIIDTNCLQLKDLTGNNVVCTKNKKMCKSLNDVERSLIENLQINDNNTIYTSSEVNTQKSRKNTSNDIINIQDDPVKINDTMQVSDFILDYSSLKNIKVCINGNILSMGDTTVLVDKSNSMISISLDINKLSRKIRKQIMQQSSIENIWSNVVCGKASDIMYDKGLIIEEIK